jgi:murein DD-endopeptidase MepM/ murein hydrolase activator NlpD
MATPRRRLLLLTTAALAAACAHGRETMTFAEAGIFDPDDAPEAPAPPVDDAAPPQVAAEPPSGPPIDATLIRFSTEARTRRLATPAGRGFPEEAVAAWERLAGALDRYLERPLPQTPLLELARALTALEAEMEWDRLRYGSPEPDLSRRVGGLGHRLRTRIDTARSLGSIAWVSPPAPAPLRWPLPGAGVSSLFGLRRHPLDGGWRMHWGVDLMARSGRVVGSAGQGWVVRAGWAQGYGLLVEVRHPDGVTTRYSHLARLLCAPGDAVDAGQPVGVVGATGRATGPHLHFEVWRGGRPHDPLQLLAASDDRDPAAEHLADATGAGRGWSPGRARAQP